MTALSQPESTDESADYPVAIGEVVIDRYRVDRFIGVGAMGLVVEARHLELDERIAIKFLRESAKRTADAAGRFAREARAAARLKSEHVARVIDVGETAKGTPFIVMEYLEGSNLDDRLARKGPFPLAEAVHLTIQMCEAAAEAHSSNIIHRDIKPANIFLVETGGTLPIAKLLDFGISKASLTGEYTEIKLDAQATSAIMGSPYYMAPEQVRSTRDVDARADIWALGAVLFELVSGSPVWRSDDLGKLVPEILSAEPRRLSEIDPKTDPAFEAVLSRALEKDVDRRFQTAAELATALLPFAPANARVHAERAHSYKQAAPGATGSLPSLRQSSRDVVAAARPNRPITEHPSHPPPSARGPSTIIAIGVAALAVVGIVVLVVPRLLRHPDATPAPTTTPVAATSTPTPTPTTMTTTTSPSTPPEPATAVPVPAPAAAPRPAAGEPRWGGARQPFTAQPAQPRRQPTSAAQPDAQPAPPSAPSPQPGSLESDPWRKNQPKLDDNPFK